MKPICIITTINRIHLLSNFSDYTWKSPSSRPAYRSWCRENRGAGPSPRLRRPTSPPTPTQRLLDCPTQRRGMDQISGLDGIYCWSRNCYNYVMILKINLVFNIIFLFCSSFLHLVQNMRWISGKFGVLSIHS